MSLILDALRKSEAERRRGQSPSLYAATPLPTTRARPAWLALLPIAGGVLLVLAAAVYWLRDDAPVTKEELVEAAQEPSLLPPTPTPAPALGASQAPTPASAPAPAPAPATPAAVAPAPAATAPAPNVDALVKTAPAGVVAAPAPGTLAAPASAAPTSDAPGVTVADAPPVTVLDASTRGSLPPMKLSMHVYNADSARRFAIIDGQRVTEGAQLGAAIVLEIRRDGVLLDVAGRRVLLPRP